MKRIVFGVLAVLAMASLVACKDKNVTNDTNNNEVIVSASGNVENSGNVETIGEEISNEEAYESVLSDYRLAMAEFDLDNLESEDEIVRKYPFVSTTLLTHVARYQSEGVNLTYQFYDIDKNGVEELLVGANGSIGAIYSYDKANKKPTHIYDQSTMERGNLLVYDNGVILSEGSGGAALHYFEFGKIASDGISYEVIENIKEEYFAESDTPEYSDVDNGNKLEYQSLDEIYEKYLGNAQKVEDFN